MNRLSCLLLVALLNITASVAATFRLDVEVTPQGSGSLNTSGGTYEEGSSIYLRTYNSTGYVFKGWYQGEELVSSATWFYYTMPQQDVCLQAKYEYDPTVPGNPAMPDTTTYYSLTATVAPLGAGSLNIGEGSYAANTSVYMRVYSNTGYKFLGWQNEEGTMVSNATSFYYTMPGRDSHLTALYEYDPSVPANPDSMATRYTVYVKCKPVGGGSFNTSEITASEGSNVRLYAYANTGYKFLRWEDEKGKAVATDQNFYHVVPHGNSTLYGVFEYNPATPANPGKNYWNKELGELIVDDFTAGYLNNAASSAVNGSSSDVTMITVAGRMNSSDFGIANNYSNCTLLDLSRVAGITEVPSYAFDYTSLESVYLPASIETIGSYAFYYCSQLAAITLYAMVPPTLGYNVFTNIAEGLVVYVPAASVARYQETDVWKNFTILPIQEDIHTLAVTLPQGVQGADFSGMWIELTNTKSGQRLHYVMTDRTQYAFPNIVSNTTWNIQLRNERGDLFGKIENVEVTDTDVEVTFGQLSLPRKVALTVLAADGTDVTAQTQAAWLDANGNYLAQTASVAGMCAGNTLYYRVTLSQSLAMEYTAPAETAYTVDDNDNNVVVCSLQPIEQVALSGKVTDLASGEPISGATVTASQTFAGKYTKTVNAKTNAQGVYTLALLSVPTTLSFASADHISQTIVCDNLTDGNSQVALDDVALKSITGATIDIGFTYTPSVAQGETAEVQTSYSDYNNVAYTIYNKTKQRAISQFNVQYPRIVLLEEVDENDQLELTATSLASSFVPVKATATIDAQQHAQATLGIVALGGLRATYKSTDNTTVVGTLYDTKGKLVKTANYTDAQLAISNLADGEYTLLTMGASSFFNNVYDLAGLQQTGLAPNTDYVLNKVTVASGVISSVAINKVPEFDESKFYYTGSNTSFTVNKQSVVAGNYLTLTARVDFKQAYAASVSDLNLIVDLPESCQFVDNSVMVGNATSSYTLDGNRLTIPVQRYTDRVRFCVIPTLGGDYEPSALVKFSLSGKEIVQPIGSACYSVQDLSISVPSVTYKDEIVVCGTAMGRSSVTVYDNGTVVGTTKALANGNWSLKCTLTSTSYLDNHKIYAVAQKDGLTVQSVVANCLYDPLAIKTSKVTMVNVAHPSSSLNLCEYVTVFNFLDPKPLSAYWYWPSYPDFTFKIEFTKNDTCLVHSVNLVVHTTNSQDVVIPASYSAKHNCWVAARPFDSSSLPASVSVQYSIFGADLSDDATYEAMVGNMLGDFTVVKGDTLPDGSRQNSVISEAGDTVGIFTDKIVEGDDEVAKLEDDLKDKGYEAEHDSIDGKIYYNDSDSTFVYIVPDTIIQYSAPEPVRRWWILTIKTSRSYEKQLISVSTNLGSKWTEHMTKLYECLKIETYQEKQLLLTRLLYKITKTWMYNSVLRIYENDKLVYKFIKNITVIRHGQEVEYKREIIDGAVKTVCIPIPCPPYPNPTPEPYPGPKVDNVLDPSGYVYEAVESNRLAGVTATAYYKETVEDMYGDEHVNIVKWDAEEYAQENPLFTDENGMYAWDVPQGLWQVKFEKEGYETAYSEWLPVPPPQLDVNIAMTQNIQPNVKSANAYEEGIQVVFDKYMDVSTVTAQSVYVTVGGNKIGGEVTPIVNDGDNAGLATTFRLVPAESLSMSQGRVCLTVSRSVKSYAGMPMADDYSQEFEIEKEITAITAADDIKLIYGEGKAITVNVIPSEAAVGKMLRVKNFSSSIVTVESDQVQIDENGQAQIMVTGELPGQAVLALSVDGASVQGEAAVNVVTEIYEVAMPVASRAGDTDVYRGTKVVLSTETPNATIYYTTDGTCPCDENGTRKKYVNPIKITEDGMQIKALTVTASGDESQVAEFQYRLKTSAVDYTLAQGWTWISHNLEPDVAPAKFGDMQPVQRIVGQTQEMVRDSNFGLVGNLAQLSAEQSYKIQTSAATDNLRLSDVARDPATPIEVKAGWNWLGYTPNQTMTVGEAFATTECQENDYIVGQNGFAQYNGSEWEGTLQTLKPGEGYLFNSQSDKQVVYNTGIVSKAASTHARFFSSSSPWAVDVHKYPQIMCMVVRLEDEDGNNLCDQNLHLGTFCNSECRGVAKIVNGKYMMSVYGNTGDKVEFRIASAESDTELILDETIDFAETMIGSVTQPHVMKVKGSVTSVQSAKSNLTISVQGHTLYLAAGDAANISSIAVINLDGAKVFETANAKSGKVELASIAPGLYVVAIVKNGEYSYHKIMIK